MKLLVDIGNQRLKWAGTRAGDALDGGGGALEFNAGGWSRRLDAELDAQLARLQRPASMWVSCVGRPQVRRALSAYARREWSLKPIFISATQRQSGIVNGYPQPTSLGSDRWAALVAARDLLPERAVIVVDAGTAATVDLLAGDGVFRGGVIFPGVQMMQRALRENTANIGTSSANGGVADAGGLDESGADTEGPVLGFATDTRAAVAQGALLAVAGGINLAIARQRESLSTDCTIVLTGGDAARLAPLLDAGNTESIRLEPALVLWGLAVIARESRA